jgi:tetratricopeptide (TPR) repeat protein
MTHVGSNLGYAYALTGQLDQAIPLMQKADEQSELIGRKAAWALRLTWLGHTRLLAGHSEIAREHGERAVALAINGGERGYQAWALKLLGDVTLDQSGDPLQARSYYDQSMEIASQLSMQPLEAHLHFGAGRLCRHLNQFEQAQQKISLAQTYYQKMDMPLWRHLAERELGVLLH